MNCLIAVAPNGARKTKADHPQLPMSPKEVGECAKQCLKAGAGMIHLHVRDEHQRHSLSVENYRVAIEQIRKQTNDGIFIQVTSEAVGSYTPEQQFSMIHFLKPPAVSIGLREIKSMGEHEINQHFIKMRSNGVFPQLILYNAIDLAMYKKWMERGILIGTTYPLLYVIGKQQPEGSFEQSDIVELSKVSNNWMVCAFGNQEFAVAKKAADLEGHVRLGFENNCLLENGDKAENNAELIDQMNHYLSSGNKRSATAIDAKKIMQPDW